MLNGNIGNWRSYGTIATTGSAPNGTTSRFAPVKVGLLIEGGYIGSYKILYCPSAAGMKAPEAVNCSPDLQDSLDIKKFVAGGGKEVFLADYATSPPTAKNGAFTLRSHYNYRGNILGFHTSGADRGGNTETAEIYLPGTKPFEKCWFGAQALPTQKAMGARAVMCDSFEKKMDVDYTNAAATKKAGEDSAGMQAHRDGYNVLYGDGHVAWYGDPQQTISYMNPAQTTAGTDNAPMAGGGVLDDTYVGTSHSGTVTDKLDGGWLVWHIMDGSNNIDKDAGCTTP